jgi:plasmid stability protein
MKAQYDFSQARRGPVVAPRGKTRITIMLDDDILQTFRDRAASDGKGYQTLINEVLREAIKTGSGAAEHLLRSIESIASSLREEMQLRRREYEVCYDTVSQADQVLSDVITALEHTKLQKEKRTCQKSCVLRSVKKSQLMAAVNRSPNRMAN